MDDRVWRRVKELFADLLDVPAGERTAWLAERCGGEAEVERELRQLLDAHEAAEEAADEATREGSAERLRIGRYTVLSRLGEGGFGTVHLAEQHQPVHRLVALKVLRAGMDTAQVVARFALEREALARMSHPSIAQIYDAGSTENGMPFFAMEYVDGVALTDYCRERRLPLAARLRLFVQVCRGVHHAHQKGVIHRDLKPSNVMVTTIDGAPVPKIIDFGIAKATQLPDGTPSNPQTLGGRFVGTPGYMSPEQVDQAGVVDVRSDVYSLGVMLFELLTERLPHDPAQCREQGLLAFLQRVRDVEAPRPSAARRTTTAGAAGEGAAGPAIRSQHLRGDLDWIALKALERDPQRRYQSADDIAEDLERHLAHEPVLAGPPDVVYRLRKFVRRNRAVAVGSVAVLFSLIVGLALALWQNGVARAALRQSTGHRLSAQALNVVDQDPTLALLLAVEGAERAPGEDADAALYKALGNHYLVQSEVRHDGVPYWSAVADDESVVLTGDDTGLVLCTELANGVVRHRFDLGPRFFHGMAIDGVGRHGVVFDGAGDAIVLDLVGGGVATTVRSGAEIADAEFLDDQGACLLACADGRLLELREGTLREFAVLGGSIGVVAVAADHTRVAALVSDRLVIVRDRATGELRRFELEPVAESLAVAGRRPMLGFTRDGDWLVCRSSVGGVDALHLRDPSRSWRIAAGGVLCSALAIDAGTLAMATRGGRGQVVDLESRQAVSLGERGVDAGGIYIDRSGRVVAVVVVNRPLAEVYDGICGDLITTLRGDSHAVYEPVFFDQGRGLMLAEHNGRVDRFRTAALGENRLLRQQLARGRYASFTVAPDGASAICVRAAADLGSEFVQVDAATGEVLRGLGRVGPHVEVGFSPAGDSVLLCCSDGTRMVRLADGAVLCHLAEPLRRARVDSAACTIAGMVGEAARVYSVVSGALLLELPDVGAQYVDVSVGGRLVAAAQGGRNCTTVWDVASGEVVRVVQHLAFAFDARFTVDGSGLLCFANDTDAQVVDVASGSILHRWRAPTSDFGFVHVGPDGHHVAVHTPELTSVYDLRDGGRQLLLEGESTATRVARPSFTANGEALLVQFGDHTVRTYPLVPLTTARELAPRRLSALERRRYDLEPASEPESAITAARLPIAAAFSLLAGREVDEAVVQRAFDLLERAAAMRRSPPDRYWLTRCMAWSRRVELRGGAMQPAEHDAAFAALENYLRSYAPSHGFLRTSKALVALRAEPGFEELLRDTPPSRR
ncbi:MAG: serine/threonine-protein kinase [Planctomycetota bacterium]